MVWYIKFNYYFFVCNKNIFFSGGDPVGALTPSLSGSEEGVQMCTDGPPHFLLPCCYTWPVIPSISSTDSGWTLHARWFLYIKHQCRFYKAAVWLHELNQNVWQLMSGLCPDPLYRVHETEGKKGGLKEEERWSGPPKIYDRSPPLIFL